MRNLATPRLNLNIHVFNVNSWGIVLHYFEPYSIFARFMEVYVHVVDIIVLLLLLSHAIIIINHVVFV